MAKVVGSSPIIRSVESPAPAGLSLFLDQSFSIVRAIPVERRASRNDAARIQLWMRRVVVDLHLVNPDGVRNTWLLKEVA